MSKAALSFLILSIMAIATDQLLPTSMDTLGAIAKVSAGLFACLFVMALIVGRRIKFDPVLRQAKP
ncbi:PA3371 family protein [Pseudomonas sp. NPDC090203]|uniref:PA3371 family protein n=1 Tax=Pseudomonas sp. NPDC090203 TaxID=3364477 RepID=UPI00380F8E33